MNLICKMFGSFLRNQSANVAMIAGLMAVPLLLVSGISVDTINAIKTRTTLQAAADAAALAAALDVGLSDAELTEIVKKYAKENGVDRSVTDLILVDGKFNSTNGTFNVEIKGSVTNAFFGMVGMPKTDVGVISQVSMGARAIDVALVLDTTGSMAGSKMVALKTAAKLFVDTVEAEKASFSSLKVGVVPFAEYVNVGGTLGSLAVAETNGDPTSGCVGSRSSAYRTSISSTEPYTIMPFSNCTAELLPLTSNLDSVRSKIASLPTASKTYIPAGLLWGWQLLNSDAPYTEAMTPAQIEQTNGRKIMILMTDGANTASAVNASARHSGSVVNDANTLTEETCIKAKADKIYIYTISFMITDPTIQTILDNCATTTANSYNADNNAQLLAAFSEIGAELAQIRLTR